MSFTRSILTVLLIMLPIIGWSQKEDIQMGKLKEKINHHEKMIRRLQGLIGEINQKLNVLEQSLPPEDLLESIYNDQKQTQEDSKNIIPLIVSLEAKIDQIGTDPKVKIQKSLTRGILSLLADNPDDAFDHFNLILNGKTSKKLKQDILMALGHSYIILGYPEQAASHFGTAIDLSRKGPQYPNALFNLGLAFQMLNDEEKRDVIWQELSKQFPMHPLSLRARKMKGLDESNFSSRVKKKNE